MDGVSGVRVAVWAGGTGVPPVTTRQHRRDACAPWKKYDGPRLYYVSNCMVPVKVGRFAMGGGEGPRRAQRGAERTVEATRRNNAG